MEWIYLVLIAAVLVFGFGVVLWNRRSSSEATRPTQTTVRPEAAPPAAQPPVEVVAPETVEPPNFRARMAKARSAFTGTFLGKRGSIEPTPETSVSPMTQSQISWSGTRDSASEAVHAEAASAPNQHHIIVVDCDAVAVPACWMMTATFD